MSKKTVTSALTLILLAVCLCSPGIQAQTVRLSAAKQVIQGRKFQISIDVINGNANVTEQNAPKLQGCSLVYGPATSTMHSVQIVNGHQSSSVTTSYTFTYSADKPGTITIPAVTVNVNGTPMSTQPQALTILPPGQSAQRQASNPYDPFAAMDEAEKMMEEMLNQMYGQTSARPSRQQQLATSNELKASDIFVRVSLSKNSVYENQALIATIKLYTKHNITNFQPTVMPQFEGFLSEELPVPQQTAQMEHVNGDNYYSVVLKKCLLYPQKSGKLTINSGSYDVTLQTVDYVSNGFYATPQSREKSFKTSSNSISVDVRPLPTPAPPSFSGAVGNFTATAVLTPERIRTNETATYTLTVSGEGNLQHLTEPIVNFPASLEQFSPSSSTDASFNGNNMHGKYTVSYPLMPLETGELEIPSWQYTYFNPEKGQYVTLDIPAISTTVGKGVPVTGSQGSTKTTDTSAIEDIRHIHPLPADSLSMEHTPLYHTTWYWAVYALGALVLIGATITYRRHIKSRADISGTRTRKARSVASKRLAKARQAMNAHNVEAFYDATAAALWGYLADRLKMPASALTRDNISDNLTQFGASQELIDETMATIDQCEMARFTPDHSDSELAGFYDKATDIINRLQRIKPRKMGKNGTGTANRMSRYTGVILALLACALQAQAIAPAETLLQQADSAYNAGNYRNAVTLYNSVLDNYGSSPQLFYNLGNAHFRAGNTGHAVVAYERALKLDPSYTDARANLDFVNSTIQGRPEDGSTFLSNIHSSVTSTFSTDGWAMVAVTLFILILGCTALYLFGNGVILRKTGFFGGAVLLLLFIYASVTAWQTAQAPEDHSHAIVTADNAKLTTTPGSATNREDKNIAIPQGSKVLIVDSLATPDDPFASMWYNVRLNNNTEAWISADAVERI